MDNSNKLNFVNYRSLCNVIAIFGGMFAVVSALAPDTIAQLFNISRSGSSSANWVNQDRTVWITLGSLSLLASWARFVVEVYAQKIFMKFFSVFFGAFAISNALHGIESGANVNSISIASIAGLLALSWFCWMNGRGVEPNTKKLASNQPISVISQEDSQKASG
tara:strand:+ start:3286 stop:3777 length:492 start_codon:yes stop_codon:yes gene_type:complete